MAGTRRQVNARRVFGVQKFDGRSIARRPPSFKVLAPVLPGDTLALRVTAQRNSLQFELTRGDITVARGQLSPLRSAT